MTAAEKSLIEAIEALLTYGHDLSRWACALNGNATYDAVRCWNEVAADARTTIMETESAERAS